MPGAVRGQVWHAPQGRQPPRPGESPPPRDPKTGHLHDLFHKILRAEKNSFPKTPLCSGLLSSAGLVIAGARIKNYSRRGGVFPAWRRFFSSRTKQGHDEDVVILDCIRPEVTMSRSRHSKITPVAQKHFLCYAVRKSKCWGNHRLPSPRSTDHRAEEGTWSAPARTKKGGGSVKGLPRGRLYLPPSWPGPRGPRARPGRTSSAGTGKIRSRY